VNAIDLFAMAGLEDEDHEPIVHDVVDDPIVSDADAPGVVALHLHTPRRPGILTEFDDAIPQTTSQRGSQLLQLLFSSRSQFTR
jgi:hypothetical protein